MNAQTLARALQAKWVVKKLTEAERARLLVEILIADNHMFPPLEGEGALYKYAIDKLREAERLHDL